MKGPTRDHIEIRQWATAHKAVPVEVHPNIFDSEPALLKFVFGPQPPQQEGMQEISWASFFATFDLLGLALVYDSDHNYELLQTEEKHEIRFEGKPLGPN